MFTRNISTVLLRTGTIAQLFFLFLFLSSSTGFAQSPQFSKDSIPVVDEEVVFSTKFKYELSKEEFFIFTSFYLNGKLDPYSGSFIINNEDSAILRVTDYLDIESGAINTYAMYMTYSMHMTYEDGYCKMLIKDITYMGKGDFERQAKSKRKLNLSVYTGKDIMIDEDLSWFMKKDSSQKVTDATIERFNEIVKDLDLIFSSKEKES